MYARPDMSFDIVVAADLDWGIGKTNDRAALAAMPSFLFFVNGTGTTISSALTRETGWFPTRTFGFVRPVWRVRWFGDSHHARAPRIGEVAHAIADEIPAIESTVAHVVRG